MAEKKHTLVANFFSLGIVQAITSLLQLVVIPYVIARIGVDGFGVIAVAQVVMFFLAAFTDYGFNQTATRDVVLHKTDRLQLSRIFSRVLFSKLILCFVSFIVLLFLLWLIPVIHHHALLYLLAFVFVVGQCLLVNWFFQGLEHMRFLAIIGLVARLLFAALVFLFIRDKEDDVLFLFFLGLGNLVAALVSIFMAFRISRLQFMLPSRAAVVREFKEGWPIMLSNLSMNTCQYANLFILRLFTNDLITGYYSIAERLFFTLRQGLVIFSQVAYPRVCQLVQEGGARVVVFFKRFYIPFLGAVTVMAILVFIFSEPLLSFFAGHEHAGAVWILRMFAIVLVIVCLNIPGTLLLLATDRKKSYFTVYMLGMVVNILFNIVLVYFFGVTGTICAIFITEVFITAGVTREMGRYSRLAKTQFKPG